MRRIRSICISVFVVAMVAVPALPALAAAGITTYLELGHATERTIFERGDTVYALADGLDSTKSYKVEVLRPDGTQEQITSCTTGVTSISSSFASNSGDSLSGANSYDFLLHQWGNTTCASGESGGFPKTAEFWLAEATAYSDSGLTSSGTSFVQSSTVFVVVNGLKSENDFSVTWIEPDAGQTCTNMADADRPDTSSAGRLPSGSSDFIQYAPTNSGTPAAWNTLANYDAATCPAPSEVGAWQLLLVKGNSTDKRQVTLSAFSVHANTAPPAPALVSPADTATTSDATPTLDWSSVVDVDGQTLTYQVQVDDDADFSSPAVNESGLSATDFTPSSDLADGTYSWRARANDGVANGAFSSVFTFTVDTNDAPPAPTLASPADTATTSDDTPTLDWDAVIDPDSDPVTYQVQVDDDADFSSPVVNESGLAATDHTVASALAEGTYSWRVRANDGTTNGAFSSVFTFTVDTNAAPPAPALASPADGASIADPTPTLDWDAVIDPDGDPVTYQVQVDDDADFSSPVVNESGLSATDHTVAGALADGTYSWRVRANDGTTNGPFSSARTFTLNTVGPDVTIVRPSGTYARFQYVVADYSCDDGDGVASCEGPIADGAVVDTSTIGVFTFTVDAEDGLGNESSEGSNYRIRGACSMTPTIVPGPGQSVVNGTAGDDVIRALEPGIDYTINGGGGNDVVCTGGGADSITTGPGHDVVVSGGGADTVSTGTGHDYVDAGAGLDSVSGGVGMDSLLGRTGADSLIGGEGDDVLRGGAGKDDLDASDGVAGNDEADGGGNVDGCIVDDDGLGTVDATVACEVVVPILVD